MTPLHRHRLTIALASVVLAVLLPTVTTYAQDLVPRRWLTPELVWPLAGVLAGMAVWTEVRRARLTDASAAAAEHVDSAAALLAAAVREQWRDELAIRQLHQPDPIALRWTCAVRMATGRDRPRRLLVRGRLENAVADYRRLPGGRLIVLGPAGSGKTVFALLLALGLLADRRSGQPVPVPLSLATWDPAAEHLDTWLARRLAEEYPDLAGASRHGRDTARALVRAGLILPVLDGLDEMPVAVRGTTVGAIRRALGGDRPAVLTSRTGEFRAADRDGGLELDGAAVIELEPVTVPDAAGFLAPARADDTRWAPVVVRLREDPAGPLASAMSTPLMIWLARTAYQHPGADPAELLDRGRFPDRDAVEAHLLDAYLPAVYADRPAAPDRRPARRCPPERAGRWLGTLARYLNSIAARDLAWWRLHRTAAFWVFPEVAGLILGAVAAAIAAVVSLAIGHYAAGAWLCLLLGVGAGLGFGAGLACATRYVHWAAARMVTAPSRPIGTFALGLAVGTGILFISRIGFFFVKWEAGAGFGYGLECVLFPAAAFAFTLALVIVISADRQPHRISVRMGGRLRQLGAVLLDGILLTVAVLLGFAILALALRETHRLVAPIPEITIRFGYLLAAGSVFGLVGVATTLLAAPTNTPRATDPRAVLRGDAAVTGVRGLGLALAAGHIGGPVGSSEWRWCSLVGLVVGLLSTAWTWFVLGQVGLVLRGRAPLRLMAFLDDAHRRGVLRQTGSTYQFRHARLQDRLAHSSPVGVNSDGPIV